MLVGNMSGIYRRTEEHKEKLRQLFTGRRLTPEWKAKISKSLTGKKQSSETIEKRVSKFRGRISPMFGKHHSEETKKKMSQIHMGHLSYTLGMKFSEKTRAKMRISAQKEEHSYKWKGNNVGYAGLHAWIVRKLGKPTKCDLCGKDNLFGKKIHWANKSGEYKREVEDWIRLCVSCHWKYDQPYLKRDRDFLGRFN